MSAVCDIALAVGLTLGGLCQAEPATDQALPPDDETAWDFQAPPPPEPPPPKVDPPPPPPAPEFPPVVIVKEAPPPPPAPEPEPAPRVEPPSPDPYRIALASVLAARPGNDATLLHVAAAPASDEAADFPETDAPDAPSPPSDASAPQEPRYASEFRESGEPVDNARIVAADRYISGIVETGINSQLSGDSGQVVIQTSRPVFGYHGRNVLIPKGSRLICDYEGPEELGQTRVAIECKRILMGGHRAEIVQLAAGVGDVQGRLGATGEVDTRFWERYGTAFVLAGISASVRLASATVATSGDETEGAVGQIADQGSQELSERLGEITAAVLENAVDLEPIVTIAQGTRITIRPAFDWYLKQANGE